jgi:hypothetical protein
MGTSDMKHGDEPSGSKRKWDIFWQAEWQSALQIISCTMEWVSEWVSTSDMMLYILTGLYLERLFKSDAIEIYFMSAQIFKF